LFGVASVAGVVFALLAMLLIVFSGVQIYAGVRVLQLADAGRRLATWVLLASGILLVLALFRVLLWPVVGRWPLMSSGSWRFGRIPGSSSRYATSHR
jgi:hypothetical protein